MPNVSSQQEDIPSDFVALLAQRRGMSTEAAAALTGEWLVRYEPGPRARARQQEHDQLEAHRLVPARDSAITNPVESVGQATRHSTKPRPRNGSRLTAATL
jgi:hypothetical protein